MSERVQVGETFHIQRPSGLWVDERTTEEQAAAIELAEAEGLRIRVHYGDVETGEDWGDLNDVEGRIGRSVGGRITSPLLVAKTRSMGGDPIPVHTLVRVRFANRREGGDLYIHPSYHVSKKAERGYKAQGIWDAIFKRHFAPSKDKK